MSVLWQFLFLLSAHWVADFLCQTHWQASNKSKNNVALSRHVLNYTIVMWAFALFLLPPTASAYFAAITFITHFATDYVTSRISSKLYAKQDWHNFFVVIGLDQLIHQVTIAATFFAFVTK
jgi:uncharacterized protein DUF3307